MLLEIIQDKRLDGTQENWAGHVAMYCKHHKIDGDLCLDVFTKLIDGRPLCGESRVAALKGLDECFNEELDCDKKTKAALSRLETRCIKGLYKYLLNEINLEKFDVVALFEMESLPLRFLKALLNLALKHSEV
ncbi:MAG: hypothetical protein SGARI_003937 [Bacillariaceae sp.]